MVKSKSVATDCFGREYLKRPACYDCGRVVACAAEVDKRGSSATISGPGRGRRPFRVRD